MGTLTIDELLFIGIEHGDLRIVTYAIENGANVHARNKIGSTPFHEAANLGRVEIGEFLLEKGADKNALNNANQKPLEIAVVKAQLGFISQFLTKDDNVLTSEGGNTLLHLMVTFGRNEMAKIYMDLGLDINVANDMGYTQLHLAILFDRAQILLDLLAHGVELTTDMHGNTPLHLAAIYDRKEIAELLLVECCMFLDITNKNGKTPLEVATEYGHTNIVELLETTKAQRGRIEVAGATLSRTFVNYLRTTDRYAGDGNGTGAARHTTSGSIYPDSDHNPKYRMAVQRMGLHRKPPCSRNPRTLMRGNVIL
ncbi:ankyrin repeat domain-containing protein [Candidatus Micrarchaeota archaeon]|nr:ankyrin repeat domain-containing protein [Candidatus Micrarchaeota archaeon]